LRLTEKRISIHWTECFGILKAYDIPIVNTAFAKTVEEAVKAAEEMCYLL
jgi:acetate---CoA ligase (ADP-forming) subunit beta